MAGRVALSTEAKSDLRRIRAWYTQAGSGPRARMRLSLVLDAIGKLAWDAHRWPKDPLCPGARMRVAEDHVVRFEIRKPADAPPVIHVLRIFGPGMERTPR